ncbi:MAG: epoxyqueuosine reductase QueH, partial [Treponema sp.]|nr:epoxyqueuosine reductase QueH [Treponema sp.]
DADMINEIGERLSAVPEPTSAVVEPVETTPHWLPSDFKKRNGFKRSLELSAEYDLYRQEYCGCIYSQAGRYGAASEPRSKG